MSTIGAFERALGCRSGKENDLIDRFLANWPARSCALPRLSPRIPTGEKFEMRPVVESWLRDLFQHRGNVGHGRKRTAHTAIWTAEEHLLLRVFPLPLLVKALLARRNDYEWTWDDQFDVDVFERLACARIFEKVPRTVEPSSPAEEGTSAKEGDSEAKEENLVWPWEVIRREAQTRAKLRRAIEESFAQAADGDANDGS